jgi:hypothetical protein
MDFSLSDLDPIEDYTTLASNQISMETKSRLDEFKATLAKQQQANAAEARQLGVELLGTQFVSGTGNKTTDLEYNCRLYSVLAMVKDIRLANRQGALSKTWQELYPDIPYNNKMTSKKVSSKHSELIIQALKDNDMYKRFRFNLIGDVIDLIKEHAMLQELKQLRKEKDLTVVELELSTDGTLYYNGVEIKKLTRCYRVTLNGCSIQTTHKSIEDLLSVVKFIEENGE